MLVDKNKSRKRFDGFRAGDLVLHPVYGHCKIDTLCLGTDQKEVLINKRGNIFQVKVSDLEHHVCRSYLHIGCFFKSKTNKNTKPLKVLSFQECPDTGETLVCYAKGRGLGYREFSGEFFMEVSEFLEKFQQIKQD